jgi:superfamily II DNA or RNA helicase
MLRPTESPVVFLQQLGRGLRKALDKDHLEVVDFVGNHRAFLSPLRRDRRVRWQSGHVSMAEDTVLFVTLQKEAGREGDDYVDAFEDAETFHWTSQRSTSPTAKKGREILESVDEGRRLHLFVRRRRQDVAFTYGGLVVPLRHEGSKPVVVWLRLLTPLDQPLRLRFLGA